MSRKFREWSPNQAWLFPPSPQDWLLKNHLVYFLLDVSGQIDISPIVKDYHGDKGGQPPFHPRMMLVLLLYSYCVGVFSSRKIMARCETDAAFEASRKSSRRTDRSVCQKSDDERKDGEKITNQKRPCGIRSAKSDCRTAVRSDQTLSRVPPVSASRS